VRSYYGAASRNVVWAAAPFVLLLGYGVWLAHEGLLLHWFNSTFSVVAVGVLFTIATALIVYTSAVGGGELIRVHADGILDLRIGPRAIRWNEIQSLTATSSEPVVSHVLRTTDGVSLSFGPSIGGVHDLIDEIRARMAEHQLPELRTRVAEGGVAHFGAITASEQGISLGTNVVVWDAVGEIEADAGEIVVRGKAGERALAAALDQVPNAFLLAELLHARRAKE
jgi:hypothetical protein